MNYHTVIFLYLIFIFWFCTVQECLAQRDLVYTGKLRKDCWGPGNLPTLLDTLKGAMNNKRIEDEYKHHDFIQTFGCAYEEADIEQNSIRAVHRAIFQSIRNRKVTFRDDLMTILQAKPPRPDNLTREYVIYVNLPLGTEIKPARYEIKILDLEAVPTVESSKSVWARVVTRFAYKEDFNRALIPLPNESEFVEVMEKAQTILRAAEDKKFSKIKSLLSVEGVAVAYPGRINELIFGDSFFLFDTQEPAKVYPAVYLGKGTYICEPPRSDPVVCKFGEERLYGLRIDVNTLRRTTSLFSELQYEAPESILQCLFLKFSNRKPQQLPPVTGKM